VEAFVDIIVHSHFEGDVRKMIVMTARICRRRMTEGKANVRS